MHKSVLRLKPRTLCFHLILRKDFKMLLMNLGNCRTTTFMTDTILFNVRLTRMRKPCIRADYARQNAFIPDRHRPALVISPVALAAHPAKGDENDHRAFYNNQPDWRQNHTGKNSQTKRRRHRSPKSVFKPQEDPPPFAIYYTICRPAKSVIQKKAGLHDNLQFCAHRRSIKGTRVNP